MVFWGVLLLPLLAADPEPTGGPGEARVIGATTSSPEAAQAFAEGRRLIENGREAEAVSRFKHALELDPGFVMARAYLGKDTAGAEGLELLKSAAADAKELPPAERLYVQLLLDKRLDDSSAIAERVAALAQAAPDDWRVQFEQGELAYNARNWKEAAEAYRKAILVGRSCPVFNSLGYALAMDEQYTDAVKALRRCAELMPNEPNPQDSVGEVQLASGHFELAEAAFNKALSLEKGFYPAMHGLAVSRFYQGDWDGGFALLERARAATSRMIDRIDIELAFAWAYLAKGDGAQALKTLDGLEKFTSAVKSEGAVAKATAQVTRAQFLSELGRHEEAIAAAQAALKSSEPAALPGAEGAMLRRRALLRRLWAEAALGRAAAAEKTLEKLQAESEHALADSEVRSALHVARGALLEAKKQPSAAIGEYAQCELFGLSEWTYELTTRPEDPLCLYQLARVHEANGIKDLAARIRRNLVAHPTRDPTSLYVWAKLKRELGAH